jgi:hypothetical protein
MVFLVANSCAEVSNYSSSLRFLIFFLSKCRVSNEGLSIFYLIVDSVASNNGLTNSNGGSTTFNGGQKTLSAFDGCSTI